MKTNTAGLSILAGGLAFAGSVGATDLIVNGSFESGPGLGWVGDFGTYALTAAYYAGPSIPASEFPGLRYSWRHGQTNDVNVPLTQTVLLAGGVSNADIDAGRGKFTFSAWLASYTQNPERPYVTLQFLDANQAPVGPTMALDRTSGQAFVTFADGVTVFDRDGHEHYWAKYLVQGIIPATARRAIVGVTRSPEAGVSGRPDTYTDLVRLDVSGAVAPPSVLSTQPTGANVSPDAAVTIVLKDGANPVDVNSLRMTFDGLAVTPTVAQSGQNTTLNYDPPGLMASASAHVVRLIAADTGTPSASLTNEFSFQVLRYYDLLLPAPLYLETFDNTAEGSLPPGWNSVSFSDVPDPNIDLSDLNSAAYAGWTVVNSARFNDPLLSYNGHAPTTDYRRVLSFNVANIVNGVIVPSLAQDKICFGNSGYRDGNSQVLYLTSPDYNLSGQTNIYLVFHSLWEQNQDSMAAVEYSIDEGASWLPIVYLIDTADFVLDGEGRVDPVATLGTVHDDAAYYTDPPGVGELKGGYYGAFIGVDSNRWSQLGPYLSGRVNDDPVESKRVEVFRLAAADNQAKVRLRFAHAGTDSWYFGLDNVGFYSLTTLNPPQLAGPTPAALTDGVGNNAGFSITAFGVGPFSYQWRRNGAALPGQNTSTLILANVQLENAGSYDVVVGYVGGSVTSPAAPLTVFTPPPALVIGQWDFNSLDLRATCGRALEFGDLGVDLATGFADSDSFLIPPLGGQSVYAMQFPGGGAIGGYRMHHGLSGTGGGSNVNQYTLIFDILYPATANNARRTLLQTDPANSTDGDLRVDENNRLGVDGVYHGRIEPDTWYRIGLAVDLTGPGPHPILAKFINGVKVGQQVLPEGRDGRWSLSASAAASYALLFADNDVDIQQGYVSSIQLRSGRLSDAAISAMGGPNAGKIPGAACVVLAEGKPVVHWSGNTLEAADEISGPWNVVPGATRPYPVPPPLAQKRYYRSK